MSKFLNKFQLPTINLAPSNLLPGELLYVSSNDTIYRGNNSNLPVALITSGGSLASSSTTGTVKTDVNLADPIVYTKVSIDNLLTNYVDLSNNQNINGVKTLTSTVASININTGALVIEGGLGVKGTINSKSLIVDVTNSTITTPSILGFNDINTGNAIRIPLGAACNSIQSNYDGRTQIMSYWGVEIYGNTQTLTPVPFKNGINSDASLNVISSAPDRPGLGVTASLAQSANLTNWTSSDGTVLTSISPNGSFITTGTITGSNLSGVNTGDQSIATIPNLQSSLNSKESLITILPINKGGTNLSTVPTNGQLLIGNGTGYSLSTLSSGTNVTINNTAGNITISATAGSSPIASSTLTGTVKTDITQTDPVVYTKTTSDSLFVTASNLQVELKRELRDYKKSTPSLLRIYPMFGEGTLTSTNTNSTVIIAGRVIYLPFVALKTGVINGINFAISTIGGTTTSSFRVAIYSDNNSLYPNALIATGTDLTGVATAGVRTITINASVTKNTLYWLGFNLANTAGTAAHTYRAGVHDNLLGLSANFSPLIGYNTTGQSTNILYTYPATIASAQPSLDGGFNYQPSFGYSYSS